MNLHFEDSAYEQVTEDFKEDFSKFVASKKMLFETSPFLMVRTNTKSLQNSQYQGNLNVKLTKLSLSLENGGKGCYTVNQTILENPEVWNCQTFLSQEAKVVKSKEYTTNQLKSYSENEFWKEIRENPKKSVIYGTDLDNSHTLPKSVIWDLDNLKTCLNDVLPKNSHIEGVTNTFAYFGFPQSYFPIHKEDADLGSVNYLLQGSPKDSERIIQYLSKHYPNDYQICPEAHRHKTFFLDIAALQEFFPDMKVFKAVQTQGTYIFTAPGTFHQGFNTGFNLASAVNFGTSQWLAELNKIKSCLCMSNIWNSKEILLNKRLEDEKSFVNSQAKKQNIKKQLEEEEEKQSKQGSPIQNCNLSTKQFSHLRSGLYAVIVAKTQADFIFSALSNILQNAKVGSYVLVPEQTLERELDSLKWQVYRVIKKTSGLTKSSHQYNKTEEMHEIQLLKKKMKLEFHTQEIQQDGEKEVNTTNKFRTPRITSFRLFRSIPKYGDLLQHCFLMPIFSSSSLRNASNDTEKGGCLHDSFYKLPMKALNSLTLEKICYISQWTTTNLEILSQISQKEISSDVPQEDYLYKFNTISILHSSFINGNCQLVLIDGDGIVRLDTIFYATLQSRRNMWKNKVFPILNQCSAILCFNKSHLFNFFAFDQDFVDTSLLPEIVESFPYAQQQEEMQHALISKFHARAEFQHLDFTTCTLSDLARFQQFYFTNPKFLSPNNHFFIGKFSSLPPFRKVYLLNFHIIDNGKTWLLCLLDSQAGGQALLSRSSYDWSNDTLQKNVNDLVQNVLRSNDLVVYYGQAKAFKPKEQFMYLQYNPPSSSIIDVNDLLTQSQHFFAEKAPQLRILLNKK